MFCLGYHVSKHKTTRYARNLVGRGPVAHLATPMFPRHRVRYSQANEFQFECTCFSSQDTFSVRDGLHESQSSDVRRNSLFLLFSRKGSVTEFDQAQTANFHGAQLYTWLRSGSIRRSARLREM